MLIVALLLCAGQAWSQNPFTGQITGRVVRGAQSREPLTEVNLSVEAGGKLAPGGETDATGRFQIDLSTLMPGWRAIDAGHLAVRFAKPGYEDVIWVLDCHEAGPSACEGLDVALTLIPESDVLGPGILIDPHEIDILNEYYQRSAPTLYVLPLIMSAAPDGEVATLMLEALQDTITNHLQILPVAPPPRDITPPPDVELVALHGLRRPLVDKAKLQLYGRYLKTLGVMNSSGNIRRDARGDEMAQLTFLYRAILFGEAWSLAARRKVPLGQWRSPQGIA